MKIDNYVLFSVTIFHLIWNSGSGWYDFDGSARWVPYRGSHDVGYRCHVMMMLDRDGYRQKKNAIAIFYLIIAIYCSYQLLIKNNMQSMVLGWFYWMSITYVTFNNRVEIKIKVTSGHKNATQGTLPFCF